MHRTDFTPSESNALREYLAGVAGDQPQAHHPGAELLLRLARTVSAADPAHLVTAFCAELSAELLEAYFSSGHGPENVLGRLAGIAEESLGAETADLEPRLDLTPRVVARREVAPSAPNGTVRLPVGIAAWELSTAGIAPRSEEDVVECCERGGLVAVECPACRRRFEHPRVLIEDTVNVCSPQHAGAVEIVNVTYPGNAGLTLVFCPSGHELLSVQRWIA